jgi:hypothetical protein
MNKTIHSWPMLREVGVRSDYEVYHAVSAP